MPYARNAELPAPVRAAYSDTCQTTFRMAFNAAMAGHGDEGRSMATGHAAAKRCMDKMDMGKTAQPMKASLLDDDAFRLLAFPFGGPIPHPAFPAGVDVDGQTFSKATDIKADWFDTRLVDWFHGQDPRMGRAILGKAVDLGRFEVKSSEPDDDGWWVTVWLKRGEERVNLVKRLAERATIYGSSETGPGLGSIKATDGSVVPWQRHISGEITAWPYLARPLRRSRRTPIPSSGP